MELLFTGFKFFNEVFVLNIFLAVGFSVGIYRKRGGHSYGAVGLHFDSFAALFGQLSGSFKQFFVAELWQVLQTFCRLLLCRYVLAQNEINLAQYEYASEIQHIVIVIIPIFCSLLNCGYYRILTLNAHLEQLVLREDKFSLD